MKSELNSRDLALVSAQAHSSEQEKLYSEQLQKVSNSSSSTTDVSSACTCTCNER